MKSANIAAKLSVALAGAACLTLSFTGVAQAASFTENSPAGGALPTGVSSVGGVVLDLIGANDTRVTTQLAASELFVGFFGSNPGTIGTQSGFNSTVTNALGGGLKKLAVRFTLFDGDTAAGNFDFNDNTLLLNGLTFGNWSNVNAVNTTGTGVETGLGFSGGGFRNNLLDTGWFYSDDSALLSSFFSTLVSNQQVTFQIADVDPFDNFFDFTQGIDSGLINVGTGPVVQPPSTAIPTPALIPGLLGMGVAALRKRKQEGSESEA